ncbi:MAG TPA: class I SAM-dependent methyltransferase [Burkholderiales bacterium]|nr:class I SAM-dependent methyltransferase [Burkholderiales bacterium]
MQKISQDNVIRAYRFYAPFYDYLYGSVLEPGRRAMSEAVDLLRPASLLEIGVGTGLMLARYPAYSKVVGIDISAEMLEIAWQRVRRLTGRDIRLEAMDAEETDFPDGFFDCVTIPYALSVTPDPERLIAEARRVCRKNGTILILNHFSGSRFWWLLEQALQSIASRVGFRFDFSFADQILKYDWEIRSVKEVNFFGLSRLVEIRNV